MSSSSTNPALQIPPLRRAVQIGLWLAAALVLAVLIWTGITSHGVPDPTVPRKSPTAAYIDIGVLVFREGLECILVLAAIMASMVGRDQNQRRPVIIGAGVGLLATAATWFVAVGVMSELTESVPALDLQAATGLVAVVVLLVIMNWFFHKVYWGGWIGAHTKRKKTLVAEARASEITQARLFWGLAFLGFTSFYREGFEIVLFLQSYRLKMGSSLVLKGAFFGAFLVGIVAVITFILQRRLPYRKMLIVTGVLLGGVLLVIVGEQAQEMQLAHWISTTEIPTLAKVTPEWMGMWFAFFPTVETIVAQALAAILVIGSYFGARRIQHSAPSQNADLPSVAVESLPAVE